MNMNEIYINIDTHIRYLKERLIIFNNSKNAFPMTVNMVLLKVLFVILETNTITDIKRIMLDNFSISHSDTETAIELLTPYITDDVSKINKRFPVELRRAVNDYKKRNHDSNKLQFKIPQKSQPELLSITLTPKCGRRCVYCFAAVDNVGDHCCMDLELFQSIIEQAAEMGIKGVELTGGDPFIIANISEYVNLVIKHRMHCYLSTKHLVDPNMVQELFDVGLREIQISLDSSEEKLADTLMGVPGSYKQVLQSIRNFKNKGFKITVRCVILKQNIGEIPDLIRLCDELNVDIISFNLYGMSCGRHNVDYFAAEEEIITLTNIIEDIKKRDIDLHIDYPSEAILQYIRSRNYSMEYKHHSRGICGAMTNSMTVRMDGKVAYCANLMNLDEMVVGDLTRQSLIEIWDEKTYERLSSPSRRYFAGTQCEQCESFDYCINKRCYFRVWMAYRRIYDKDPMCKYGIKEFQTY